MLVTKHIIASTQQMTLMLALAAPHLANNANSPLHLPCKGQ